MTCSDLKAARVTLKWMQAEAARHLGVTQAYLSMVERGTRPVSEELAIAALAVYPFAAKVRPLHSPVHTSTAAFYKESLGELGYPGFAYLASKSSLNPAELLLRALDEDELDARVVEALPWLPYHFPEMNWEWLLTNAKLRDRQNRLAFVTALALQAARERGEVLVRDALPLQYSVWNGVGLRLKTPCARLLCPGQSRSGFAAIERKLPRTGTC